MNRELVSFENTYIQGPEEISWDIRGHAAKGCVTIDGYPADENEEGEVVCNVWMTNDHNFIIDWHNNGYRSNPQVLELIENSMQILMEQYPREETPFSLLVFPEIEFDNGTAVICKYHGQHNLAPEPGDIMTIVDAVKESYEAAGMHVTRARPVSENAYALFEARDSMTQTEKETPLDKTTISWKNENVSIQKNMLTDNPPDRETRFCQAVYKAWDNGYPKNEQAQALMDLYGLCPQKPLFCSLYQTLSGKPFINALTELLENDTGVMDFIEAELAASETR